ncbi:hypothetical protein J2S74_005389 [Evansella vedderi]|uniref:Uncharacterized protein n=1 Tax=Evansella vedderi TaxID=38282 RepID=A0ABU0A360_9BACI|nr:hypothetical protein [Evansella vedderi]MDQ0257926.1 hypothetical protein [Evansella vedderi]
MKNEWKWAENVNLLKMSPKEIETLHNMDPLTRKFTLTFKYDERFGWNRYEPQHVDLADTTKEEFLNHMNEWWEQCSGNGVVKDWICQYDSYTYTAMNKSEFTEFLYRFMNSWTDTRTNVVADGFRENFWHGIDHEVVARQKQDLLAWIEMKNEVFAQKLGNNFDMVIENLIEWVNVNAILEPLMVLLDLLGVLPL